MKFDLRTVGVLFLSGVALLIGWSLSQCVLPQGRQGTVDHNPVQAQVDVDADILAALAARIERLEVSLARIDKLEAELNIGGEGDSVVSWILAVGIILISTLSGGLFYQLVLRPMRRWRDPAASLDMAALYKRVGQLEMREEQRE